MKPPAGNCGRPPDALRGGFPPARAAAVPCRVVYRPGSPGKLSARITILLLPLATWVGAAEAAAQARPDTLARDSIVIPLREVRVQVARPLATAGGASAVLVAIDSLRLAPAPTLEQVMRELPFVQVRENSRGEAQLSLRGSEARQVAVLVDGVPLSLGWDHRADLSVVPVAGAQSVLLVRGLSSVLHGPNVLGGVVEVGVSQGTFPLEDPEPLRVRAGIDHLGGHAVGLIGAAPLPLSAGQLLVRAGVGHRSRPGVALSAQVEEAGARGGRLRENSDLEQGDAFLALRYHGEAGDWLSLSASGYRAERGVPPELHLAEPRFWRYPEARRMLAVVSGGTGQRATVLGRGDLEASLGIDLAHTEIDAYAGRDFQQVTGGERANDRTLTLRLLGDHTLLRRGELRGAATLAEVRHDERLDPGGAATYRQRLWSLGSEVAWPLSPEARGGWLSDARLSGGVALDGADTPETGGKLPLDRLWATGGRLGFSTLAAEGAVLLHLTVSRRARFPSLRELYSGALGRFVPNPELRPERLVAGEAGMTIHARALEFQAVAFHHVLTDAIVRASVEGGRFRRENRDRIRSRGLELLGGWSGWGASLEGELTLQRVRVHDPDALGEAHRAEYQPEVAGGLDLAAPLALGVRGVAGVDYVGRQWCVHPDLRRDVALDPGTRLDLRLERVWRLQGTDARRLLRALGTVLALDNAADARIYDQCGLPQPGRTLRLQLELR